MVVLVAALMESLAAGVATAQEEVCEGERKAGRRRERVVVAAWWLCWLPVVELVFVVVYRLGLLVLSLEKAAVEEVERAAESR